MDRRRFLATPALALVGTRLTAQMSRPSLTASAGEVPDSDVTSLPELGGAVDWLNSDPLRRRSLRGKVVLVNFWTYSCINSLRPLPYVKDWAARYKDAGFVVIGVHTPEFGFEKERPNVEQALRDLKIPYPVPMDSNYKIWQAFRNEAWPALPRRREGANPSSPLWRRRVRPVRRRDTCAAERRASGRPERRPGCYIGRRSGGSAERRCAVS